MYYVKILYKFLNWAFKIHPCLRASGIPQHSYFPYGPDQVHIAINHVAAYPNCLIYSNKWLTLEKPRTRMMAHTYTVSCSNWPVKEEIRTHCILNWLPCQQSASPETSWTAQSGEYTCCCFPPYHYNSIHLVLF